MVIFITTPDAQRRRLFAIQELGRKCIQKIHPGDVLIYSAGHISGMTVFSY